MVEDWFSAAVPPVFDRRIQLGVLAVVFGAAATYVFYTYLTPIMRDEVHVPEQYLSVGLVIFGAACLWSNLYGASLPTVAGEWNR